MRAHRRCDRPSAGSSGEGNLPALASSW